MTADSLLTGNVPTIGEKENPAHVRHYRPPRWCPACDAGCSVESCWLCAGPTVPTAGRELKSDGTPKFRPGSLPARSLPGASSWWPQEDGEQ